MRRGIFAIGLIAAAISAAVSFHLWNELEAAHAEAASVAVVPAPPKPTANPPVESPPEIEKPSPPPPPPKATPAAAARPLMACREWWRLVNQAQQDDPKWRAATLALYKVNSQENWPTMASDLNLSDEQASALYDLLAERQLRESFAGLKPAATTEELQENMRLREQAEHENDSSIAALLGPEKNRQFKEYRESAYARTQVDELETAVGSGDDALRPDQIKALTRALYKGTYVSLSGEGPVGTAAPAMQSPHDIAAKILSADQLARFDELQRLNNARSEVANRIYKVQREAAKPDKTGN